MEPDAVRESLRGCPLGVGDGLGAELANARPLGGSCRSLCGPIRASGDARVRLCLCRGGIGLVRTRRAAAEGCEPCSELGRLIELRANAALDMTHDATTAVELYDHPTERDPHHLDPILGCRTLPRRHGSRLDPARVGRSRGTLGSEPLIRITRRTVPAALDLDQGLKLRITRPSDRTREFWQRLGGR